MSTPPRIPGEQRFLSIFLSALPIERFARLEGHLVAPVAPAGAGAPSPGHPSNRHPRRQGWRGEVPTPTAATAAPMPAFATVSKEKGALRLAALDEGGAALGLKPGMSLADARAIHPALRIAEADPPADKAMLEAITDWCRRWTPLSALDAPDGVMLDISGCAHLFGGERAMLEEVRASLSRQGWSVRGAIASTPACAWALARFGAPPDPRRRAVSACILARGGEAHALRDLPVAALRLPQPMVEALARVGLRRVGDLAERPRAPLAARFGEGLLRRLDEASGLVVAPIDPRAERAPYVVERRFFEPVVTEDDVLRTLAALAAELGRRLERQDEGARRLELTLFRVDGAVRRAIVGVGRPTRDPRLIASLFRERLAAMADALDPGFGFDVVRLSALEVDRLGAGQIALDPARDPRPVLDRDGLDHDVLDLLDRLGARLGVRRVQGFISNDTHIPEFAVSALPASFAASLAAPLAASATVSPASVRGARAGRVLAPDLVSAALEAERPLRLFATAERVEAIAAVPDGPPLHFRWRQVFHHVRKAEGPERIGPEWWKSVHRSESAPEDDEDDEDEIANAGAPERPRRAAPTRPGAPRLDLTRDYFRVEDSEGRRFWLYREGLYGEPFTPRWFLHGVFA